MRSFEARKLISQRTGLLSFAGLFCALFACGVLLFGPKIETALTLKTQNALRQGSISGATVSYDGRDATVLVPAGADAAAVQLLVRTAKGPKNGPHYQGPRTVKVITKQAPISTAAEPDATTPPTVTIPPSTSVPAVTQNEPVIPEEGSVTQDSVLASQSAAELQATLDELVGLQTIEFLPGSPSMTSQGLSVVNGLARLLDESSSNIEVIVSADDAPATSNNQALSEQRANAIKTALMGAGVEPSRVLATGSSSGARRIEFRVVS